MEIRKTLSAIISIPLEDNKLVKLDIGNITMPKKSNDMDFIRNST